MKTCQCEEHSQDQQHPQQTTPQQTTQQPTSTQHQLQAKRQQPCRDERKTILDMLAASVRAANDGDMFMPWWPVYEDSLEDNITDLVKHVYHTRAHLPNDLEALLLDLGAYDNLTGDKWANRTGDLARAAGQQPVMRSMSNSMRVQGVGKQAQTCQMIVDMPGRLENGEDMVYSAPVVPDSDIPALLGLKSVEKHDGVVDARVTERKLYMGSDVQVVPGPRTTVLQLYPAMSGHLMLPISHYRATTENDQQRLHLLGSIEKEKNNGGCCGGPDRASTNRNSEASGSGNSSGSQPAVVTMQGGSFQWQ